MIDVNESAVLSLLKKPGNDTCADCGCPDPEWASYNIGIFVCTRCAGLHRGLGVHVSKIKHLKLDKWEENHVKQMEEMGNLKAQTKYEKFVPLFYRRPKENDPHVLIEQWIKAKYSREEFMHPEQQTYAKGKMEGYLWKRGKNDPRFQPRRFTLSENDGILKYYVKEKKSPKAVLRLAELNVVLSPEKVGHPNSMQLTYLKEGTTRHIYVQHSDPQVIVDWYQAIRCAKLHRLQVAFPAALMSQLLPMLSNDFAMEGWLWKTGPKMMNGYKKRWFTLDNRKLMYHEHPLDPHPKGEIFLGNMLSGYSVRVGVPPKVRDQGFSFTLRTPGRTFHLTTSREDERDSWIRVIEETISKQLTPQDNFMAAHLIRKRTATAHLNIFSRDIDVPFSNEREAEIAYEVLRVDKEPSRSQVSKSLNLEGNVLHALFITRLRDDECFWATSNPQVFASQLNMGEHTPAPTPSRGVYGFALYLSSVCGFSLYVIWAVVPDEILHSLGITYYPQKYWAIALPVYCMMGLAVFAFFIYPGLNLLLTPPLDSMRTVTDSHAVYKDMNEQENFFNKGGGGEESNVHGIPPAYDIHISQVCQNLYSRKAQ